jgi:hypothetical protein
MDIRNYSRSLLLDTRDYIINRRKKNKNNKTNIIASNLHVFDNSVLDLLDLRTNKSLLSRRSIYLYNVKVFYLSMGTPIYLLFACSILRNVSLS